MTRQRSTSATPETSAVTSAPLVVLLLMYVLVQCLPARMSKTKQQLSYLMLTVTFTVLPPATTTSVNAFLCQRLDTHDPPGIDDADTAYLVSDWSQECYTPRHQTMQARVVVFNFDTLIKPINSLPPPPLDC